MHRILWLAPVLIASAAFAGPFSSTGFLLTGTLTPTGGSVQSLSTGVANWQASGPNVVGTGPALVLTGSLNSLWLAPPPGSAWVGTQATDGLSPGNATGELGSYTYTLAVATGGVGGSLSYIVAGDNQVSVVVLLNGSPINLFNHPGNTLNADYTGCAFLPVGSTLCGPPPSLGQVGPGTIAFAAGGAGLITITATVVNTSDPVSSTPEPSTLLLGSAGLAGLILWRRKQTA